MTQTGQEWLDQWIRETVAGFNLDVVTVDQTELRFLVVVRDVDTASSNPATHMPVAERARLLRERFVEDVGDVAVFDVRVRS